MLRRSDFGKKIIKTLITIARFEILDINLTHVAETKNTVAYILALIVYTELRL